MDLEEEVREVFLGVREVLLDVREVLLDIREVFLDIREVFLDIREVFRFSLRSPPARPWAVMAASPRMPARPPMRP
jgi:hypothetical protein